jgi:hypothetical protein
MNFQQQTNTGRRNKSNIFPHLPWRGCTFSPNNNNNKNPRLLLHQTLYHPLPMLTHQTTKTGREKKNKQITTTFVYPREKTQEAQPKSYY